MKQDSELLIDEEELTELALNKSKSKKITYPIWLTKKLKELDKELEHKLPNELRWQLRYSYNGGSDFPTYLEHGFF
jgi:hypothetical protein